MILTYIFTFLMLLPAVNAQVLNLGQIELNSPIEIEVPKNTQSVTIAVNGFIEHSYGISYIKTPDGVIKSEGRSCELSTDRVCHKKYPILDMGYGNQGIGVQTIPPNPLTPMTPGKWIFKVRAQADNERRPVSAQVIFKPKSKYNRGKIKLNIYTINGAEFSEEIITRLRDHFMKPRMDLDNIEDSAIYVGDSYDKKIRYKNKSAIIRTDSNFYEPILDWLIEESRSEKAKKELGIDIEFQMKGNLEYSGPKISGNDEKAQIDLTNIALQAFQQQGFINILVLPSKFISSKLLGFSTGFGIILVDDPSFNDAFKAATVAHELGHALGLNHADTEYKLTDVMNSRNNIMLRAAPLYNWQQFASQGFSLQQLKTMMNSPFVFLQ